MYLNYTVKREGGYKQICLGLGFDFLQRLDLTISVKVTVLKNPNS